MNANDRNQEVSNSANVAVKQFHLEQIFQKRLIATFIDLVLTGVATIILSVMAMMILPTAPINFAAMFSFFISAAAAALILVKDAPFKIADLLDGQTPGKKAMNIRVTDLQGSPITLQMSIHRNIIPALPYLVGALANLINVIPFQPVTGLLTFFIIIPLMGAAVIANIFEIYKIFKGERNRRWGDEFAGTIVAWE
jgi:uncharacterized RDD family membrane protein YckC